VRLASRVALALGSAVFLASFAAPTTARAMGAIVSSPPGASSAVALRFAVATSDEQGAANARWASVTVQGSASAFAWIVPVRPGALLELSPDAWLEALEAATAPRVVPPDATPPCGFSGGAEVEGSFTPTTTTAPGAVVVATDRPTLDTTLASWGLSVTPELSAAIDAVIASGSDLVVMLFTDASGTVVTRTLRVVDDAPAGVPLSLLTGGANTLQVTAFAMSRASTAFGAQPDLTVDPAALLWRSDGTSSYASARDAMFEENPGRWLLETSSASLVSTSTKLPDGATVPSLVSAYDSLAANDAGISDDLAVALGVGDAGTRGEWLARGRTVVAAGSVVRDAPLTGGALEPIGPIVTAGGYAQTCEASAPPPPQQGSSGNNGSTGAPSNQGTSSGAVDIGAGAASAAASSSDGCGGDSADSGDGCGGDTSSSSEGTDPSSSDSSSGCSGSTTDSSSDSGSGCSGSSDSSSSSDCSVYDGAGRGKNRHSGTSRFLVLLVGIAALCRRRRSI
jgi:hypothetical protein